MRKITNEELGRPSAEEFAAMEKMPVTVVYLCLRSDSIFKSLFSVFRLRSGKWIRNVTVREMAVEQE